MDQPHYQCRGRQNERHDRSPATFGRLRHSDPQDNGWRRSTWRRWQCLRPRPEHPAVVPCPASTASLPREDGAYLAYLDCVRSTASNSRSGVGIFLRRLSEPDQYARINCSGRVLLDLGKGKHHACNRPREIRTLFVH